MNKCTCSYDDNMHDSHCAINGYVESDPLLPKAKEWSLKEGYVSVSYLQRILRVGYTRAARLVELLIEEGFCEEARVHVDSPRHKIVAVEQLRAADGAYCSCPEGTPASPVMPQYCRVCEKPRR